MFILVIGSALIALTSAGNFATDYNCTGKPDGLAWWGCRSYGSCFGEEHQQIDCLNRTAYDQQSQQCVDEDLAGWPCNTQPDCSPYSDTVHRIPEVETDGTFDACQFYYTCNYGIYVGHQMCGDGLVYSEANQNCLPREFVPSPCGDLDAFK